MDKAIKHSGADWMAKQSCFKDPSSLAIKVVNVLGQVYLGIYHISDAVKSNKVDWQNASEISVTVYGELATFDGGALTCLLLCCVETNLSVKISGRFKAYTQLTFSQSDFIINLDEKYQKLKTERLSVQGFINSYSQKPPIWKYQNPLNVAFSISKTIEMDELVEIVLFAHLAMLRISIQGRSFGSLQIQFSQRVAREGNFWERHPDLAMAQSAFAPYVLALEGDRNG